MPGSIRKFPWVVVVIVVSGLLAFLWMHGRQHPLPEKDVAELALVDGRLCVKGGRSPFTGRMIEHYAGGGLRSRSSVSNGLLEGLSTGWHANGQKQVEENFSGGVSHGLRVKWHVSGVKQSECTIQRGEIEGVFRRWDTNGVLAEVISMKHGKPDGLCVALFPSGSVKTEARMAAGQVVTQQFWKDGERACMQVASNEAFKKGMSP